MVDSVASPDWTKTSVVVIGSSSAVVDAAVEVVVVVVSWAEMTTGRRRKARRMNCGTFMINALDQARSSSYSFLGEVYYWRYCFDCENVVFFVPHTNHIM